MPNPIKIREIHIKTAMDRKGQPSPSSVFPVSLAQEPPLYGFSTYPSQLNKHESNTHQTITCGDIRCLDTSYIEKLQSLSGAHVTIENKQTHTDVAENCLPDHI